MGEHKPYMREKQKWAVPLLFGLDTIKKLVKMYCAVASKSENRKKVPCWST
jgi:hypothetical protein